MTRVSFVNIGKEHLQFNCLMMGMQFASTFVNLVDYSNCPEIHYLIVNPEHFTSTKPIQECRKPEKENPLYALENLRSRYRYIHS